MELISLSRLITTETHKEQWMARGLVWPGWLAYGGGFEIVLSFMGFFYCIHQLTIIIISPTQMVVQGYTCSRPLSCNCCPLLYTTRRDWFNPRKAPNFQQRIIGSNGLERALTMLSGWNNEEYLKHYSNS